MPGAAAVTGVLVAVGGVREILLMLWLAVMARVSPQAVSATATDVSGS